MTSSMATVCGASMALMDAGAPLKAPVAGIAMGDSSACLYPPGLMNVGERPKLRTNRL